MTQKFQSQILHLQSYQWHESLQKEHVTGYCNLLPLKKSLKGARHPTADRRAKQWVSQARLLIQTGHTYQSDNMSSADKTNWAELHEA